MTDKPLPPLPLTAAQVADFKTVIRHRPDAAMRIDEAIRSLPLPPIRATHLFKVAQTAIGDADGAEAIVRLAISLAAFTNRSGIAAKDVVLAMEAGLAKRSDWESRAGIDQHLGAIAELVGNEAIGLAAKAIELSYDHDRIFSSARVITDVRTVLDEPRETPRGAIITHSLKISYLENNRPVEITIAVDADDLQAIIKCCSDGQKKTEAVKKLIHGVPAENIFVAGDENYGSG
ncbi:MAG: hypothetical protein ACKVP3_05640 [Hyphomicrobiaceae bacterium]